MNARSELVERFFRYAAIESQSDERVPTLPSTAGQHELAALLAAELRDLGLANVVVDRNAIVTAMKRGDRPGVPRIGFIAHLDTANVGLSPSVRPQIKRYVGEDLCLNRDKDIWFRANEHPEAEAWRDQDIIFSDGTSVLGADNKAAIAVIMTLLSHLSSSDAHGDICVAFVPDEEIGLRGAKALDLSRFPCDFAYTIDCCELGEVVIENFNAALGEIAFTGVSAHPMSAKGVLVNPLLMALDFVGQFDRSDTPECTEGTEGYFWFNDLLANDSEARLSVMIRDFDKAHFERRKQLIAEAAELSKQRYPSGRIEFKISDTYQNISDSLGDDRRSIELLLAALEELDIKPKLTPMRGGTDGAALSARGLTTPNFFTGAHNFHSRFEFLPIPAFEKSFQTALMICRLAVK
ncbi:peptidase T [Ensifer aridi]|uniref:peptidase T n=1 Tax=Ensifer aridi TaxID=1708715 RepID=UPI000A1166B6|nr:peptidase T [Ensifer aridi]